MAVSMRLKRGGAKDDPFYRVIVMDSRRRRDGAVLETLGHYNPKTDPATIQVDQQKAMEWFSKGALPSGTVRSLLLKTGMPPADIPRIRRK